MPTRDYEFDVAPELLAAVRRGTSGPLLDAASTYVAAFDDAVRSYEAEERRRRDQQMAQAVEASTSAHLAGVSAHIGKISSRVTGTGLGEPVPGSENRLGGNAGVSVGALNPAGGRKIRVGRYWVAGVSVDDFLLGQRLGAGSQVSLTQQDRIDLKARINVVQADIDDLNRQLEQAYQEHPLEISEEGELIANPGISQLQTTIEARSSFQRELLRQLNRRRDNPDADVGGTSIATTGHQFSLLQRLRSLGGLGFRDPRMRKGEAIRVPNIVRAADPAPDADTSTSYSSELRFWQQQLIDPTPEL